VILDRFFEEVETLSEIALKLLIYVEHPRAETKFLRRLYKSIEYHYYLTIEQLSYSSINCYSALNRDRSSSARFLLEEAKRWELFDSNKYKSLKQKLFNSLRLSNLDRIGSDIQESIVHFARLPLGHSFDFICLAPWVGLDSVIEEISEDVTISSEEEVENNS